jgi:hypothetical protein
LAGDWFPRTLFSSFLKAVSNYSKRSQSNSLWTSKVFFSPQTRIVTFFVPSTPYTSQQPILQILMLVKVVIAS